MILQAIFRRAARAEFTATAAWYEAQRENLRVEFIAAIEHCVYSVFVCAGTHHLAAQSEDLSRHVPDEVTEALDQVVDELEQRSDQFIACAVYCVLRRIE